MEKKVETIGIIGILIGYILGLYRDNGKENGNYKDYRDYNRVYWGCIGIMEKKMETIRIIGIIIGCILGLYRDNGKENGNHKDYRDYNRVYIGVI